MAVKEVKPFRTEKEAVAWFVKRLRASGAYVQKMQLQFTLGFPDLLVVQNGVVAFYECKLFRRSLRASFDQVEAIQWQRLRELAAAGTNAWAVVLRSPEELYLVKASSGTNKAKPRQPAPPLPAASPEPSCGRSVEP